MARELFPAFVVELPSGDPAIGLPFTVWDDEFAGNNVTAQLRTPDGITTYTAAADNSGLGQPFRGPDGVQGPLFCDTGVGARFMLISSSALRNLFTNVSSLLNGSAGAGGGVTSGGVRSVNNNTGPDVALTAEDIPNGPTKQITTAAERQQIVTALQRGETINWDRIVDDNGQTVEAKFGTLPTNNFVLQGVLEAGTNPSATAPAGYYLQKSGTATAPSNQTQPLLVGATAANNNSSNLTVPLPPNCLAGDTIAFWHEHNCSDGAATPAAVAPYFIIDPAAPTQRITGTGWAGRGTGTIGSNNRFEIYTRLLTSGDISGGSITVTYTGPQKACGAITVHRNVGTPVGSVVPGSVSQTTRTVPNITAGTNADYYTATSERRTDPNQTATPPTTPGQQTLVASTARPVADTGATSLFVAHDATTLRTGSVTGGTWTVPVATSSYFTAALAFPSV